MSRNGFLYHYPIASKSQLNLGKEIEIVGNAFQYAGWKEVDILPATGFPTHIVFEWQKDGPPIFPNIDFS